MVMPITFDSALTQHTTATRRLQSLTQQIATGKREMGGIQLDPANFSMAAKFDAQVHRMDAALSNTGNAMSMLQTQDGTLRSVGKAMNRMGELAILAQDVTKSDSDRALYAEEFTQLKTMVSDSAGMKFNGVEMFGSQTKAVTVDEDGGTTELPAIDLQKYVARALHNDMGSKVPYIEGFQNLGFLLILEFQLTHPLAFVDPKHCWQNYIIGYTCHHIGNN